VTTPVRAILVPHSRLHQEVADGLGALKKADKKLIEEAIRNQFSDSVDIDAALKAGHDQENRWDYLLGHDPTSLVVALEPHSASTSEVSTVIEKRAKAKEQLRAHLKQGAQIVAWYWVASGKIDFVPHEKQVNRLNQAGINFVGSRLVAKHLPKKK
jgi:hypothetical protein